MILEGIVTTTNADGSAHIAPMGPIVDPQITRLTLRPYQTSTTLKNLLRQGQGVFHVTDDVELLALSAVGRLEVLPRLTRAERIDGWILANACHWFAFEVRETDVSEPRACLEAEVVDRGRIRDFLGFNRARHAVVEAAIMATRVNILPASTIIEEMRRLSVLVEKTGGAAEHRAFDFLDQYIGQALDAAASQPSQGGGRPTDPGVPFTP